ncbi:MAG TPA: hypothetical protein PK961_17840 [bacterium]|nr:hypothetical protein [bacterium]
MRTLLSGTLSVFALCLITIIFSTANANIEEPDDGAESYDWQDEGVGVYSSLRDAADDEGVNMTLWDAYADTHGVDH